MATYIQILKKFFLLIFAWMLFCWSVSAAAVTTLRQAVDQTVHSNPDVLAKVKGWLASQQTIKQARSGYLPKLNIGASAGLESLNSQNTLFERQSLHPMEVNAILTQMIFDGFSTSNDVKRSRSRTMAEEFQVQGTSDEIALLAIKAYLDVLRTQKIADFAAANYKKHQSTYTFVKDRSKQDSIMQTDTKQAYGRMALSKANLLEAQNNYTAAKVVYYKVIGSKPNNLAEPIIPVDTYLPRNLQSAIVAALDGHPFLKSAKASIEEARAEHNASKASNLPQLDAIVLTRNGHDTDDFEGRNNSILGTLHVHYNLFNGGADMAKQTETALLTEKAKEEYKSTYNQVVENMHLAWDSLETNKAQTAYYANHSAAAKITAEEYLEQFKSGQRTIIDLLDVEDELFNAQADYTNNKFNIIFSKYRVLAAEGKLLSYFQIPVASQETAIP